MKNNTVINCKEIAQKVKQEVKEQVAQMETQPHLVVIQVGSNPASSTYVRNKERVCEEVGIKSTKIELDENISQRDLEFHISFYSSSEEYHGVLLQLPLPSHLDEQSAIRLIHPRKDVDGLTPYNQGLLSLGDSKGIVPCTPLGVMRILKECDTELSGAETVVVGRSNLFGKPMGQLLLQANATVTMCHSKTKNLKRHTSHADVVICAVGRTKMFNTEYFTSNQTIIDVGINRDENGKLCGDCDTNDIIENNDNINITPVPGGVGVMTTAMLMENVLKCAKLQGVK